MGEGAATGQKEMTETLGYLFAFFVFPGFIFSSVLGLFIGWIDRKVTARLQYRVGPPWYQNYFDVLKLALYKETLIPTGVSKALFLGMPMVGLASASLVSTILVMTNIMPNSGFIGDVIVVVYLLLIPPIALMVGGFSSRNTLASLGASREMKSMLSYELPFIIALVVPIAKAGYSIKLGDMLIAQHTAGSFITSASGVLSFVSILLCIQAKLGFVPFDMPEAETEIVSGPYLEYSGKALAIFKLTKAVLAFALPLLVVMLFFGGVAFSFTKILSGICAYLCVVVLSIVIKNTNPRVRIDQAMRFFWGPVTVISVLSAVLVLLGH